MISRNALSLTVPAVVALGIVQVAQASIWNGNQNFASASLSLRQFYADFTSGTDLMGSGGFFIPSAPASSVLPIVNRSDSSSLDYPGGSLSSFGRTNASVTGDVLSVNLETRATLSGTPDLASFEGFLSADASSEFTFFGELRPFTRVEFTLLTFAPTVTQLGDWFVSVSGDPNGINANDGFIFESDGVQGAVGSTTTLVNTSSVSLNFEVFVRVNTARFIATDPNGSIDLFEVGTSTSNLSFGLRAIESPIPTPGGASLLAICGLLAAHRRR